MMYNEFYEYGMEYYFIIVTITVLSDRTLYRWHHLVHLYIEVVVLQFCSLCQSLSMHRVTIQRHKHFLFSTNLINPNWHPCIYDI